MSAILVGAKRSPFRLPVKVGGPSRPARPTDPHLALTPAQKRRRLDAAYFERFFAREQRRLCTGILGANERETVKLPSKGRIQAATAEQLGLVRNPNASPNDPEATHWIPAAPTKGLQRSPFWANPKASGRWPDLIKPLLSPLKYRRLFFAAKRQGLEHLMPHGPAGLEERFTQREVQRVEAANEDTELLQLAAKHWRDASPVERKQSLSATEEETDKAMRGFAIGLPKFSQHKSEQSLFPYVKARLRYREQRAQKILEAMQGMSQKVAAYRQNVRSEKLASRRASPL